MSSPMLLPPMHAWHCTFMKSPRARITWVLKHRMGAKYRVVVDHPTAHELTSKCTACRLHLAPVTQYTHSTSSRATKEPGPSFYRTKHSRHKRPPKTWQMQRKILEEKHGLLAHRSI